MKGILPTLSGERGPAVPHAHSLPCQVKGILPTLSGERGPAVPHAYSLPCQVKGILPTLSGERVLQYHMQTHLSMGVNVAIGGIHIMHRCTKLCQQNKAVLSTARDLEEQKNMALRYHAIPACVSCRISHRTIALSMVEPLAHAL